MREKKIAEIQSGRSSIFVTLRENENLRFLLIRMYKRDGGIGAFVPTDFAVGMDAPMFTEFKIVLDESEDAIQEWFGPREVTVVETVRGDMLAQTKAQKEATQTVHNITVGNTSWKEPTFFRTRSEGARVAVELNTTHPGVASLGIEHGSTDSARKSLGTILAAYHDAKTRFSGPDHPNASQFFRALEYEWGVILMQYCRAVS
jgi:hypothetical protein